MALVQHAQWQRDFIATLGGGDISKKYCELADKRIDNVVLSKKLGGV